MARAIRKADRDPQGNQRGRVAPKLTEWGSRKVMILAEGRGIVTVTAADYEELDAGYIAEEGELDEEEE